MMNLNKNTIWLAGLLFAPLANYAQEIESASTKTYFSNALFNTLLVIIIVLLLVVIGLSSALKNIAHSEYIQDKFKKKQQAKNNQAGIKSVMIVFLLLAAYSSTAQTNTAAAANSWLIGGLDMFTFFFMLTLIFLECVVIAILYRLIMGMVKADEVTVVTPEIKTKTILEKINASVDIEKEAEITLDHNYDGITELDNDLPPWWKYGFYLTILIGVVYLINFHITGTGDLQTIEYEKSLAAAKAEIEEYMKTAANNVDETTVKQLEGADVEAGKEFFTANCAACHGKFGQGTVGPNLTDEYWLHGGSISDIFKTIKYGWVDKGMKSWKEDLSPMQIAQIASFIRTLKGTNPDGAKAPQGDLYKEEVKTTNDSLQIKADTLSVAKDTIQ